MSLNYLTEHFVLLGVVALLYHFFYRRNDQYGANRLVLLGTLLLSVLVPLFDFAVFPYELITTTRSSVFVATAGLAETATSVSSVFPIWQALYISGCVLIASFYGRHLFLIYRAKRNSSFSKHGNLQVAYGETNTSFSFLNYLFLEKKDDVLFSHEKAHAQLWHSLDRIFMAILHIVFWFNPLLFIYRKWLIENHEFAADKLAIEDLKIKKSDYAQYLVEFSVFGPSSAPFTNHFSSQLKTRIIMLNTNQKFQSSYYLVFIFTLIVLCSGFTMKSYPVYGEADLTFIDTIPSQTYINDTVVVFDPKTFTETFTVTRRPLIQSEWDTTLVFDPVTKEEKVLIHKGKVGSSTSSKFAPMTGSVVTSIDTTVIFDPQTYKERMIVERVSLPEGVAIMSGLSSQKRTELIDRIGERTTLSINSYEGDVASIISFGAPHEGFSLVFTDESGTEVSSKKMAKGISSYDLGQLKLNKGKYTATRSDNGQQISVVIE